MRAIDGVNEPEMRRVESLASEAQFGEQRLVRARLAIDRIAEQRMADMSHMDAHLMRTPGLEPTLDEGSTVQPLQRAIVGDGMLTPTLALHRHFLAIGVRATDPRIDSPRRRGGHAADEGKITPVNAVLLELPRQTLMGPVRLGNDEEPGRVLVDAVHDPWPSNAADARKLPGTVMKQRIDECAIRISGGGMDDHASRLVDDDEMLVLVNDDQIDLLRHRLGRRGLGNGEGKSRFGAHLERRIADRRTAGSADMTGEDQRLHALARQLRHKRGKRTIKPDAMQRRRDFRRNIGSSPRHEYNLGTMLRLSRTLIAALQSETAGVAPQECCGLLLGDAATLRIDAILPAANVAADPLHRFEIDPATLLGAHKAARAGGPQIAGHYHSHPLGEPLPSACDAAMAQGDGEIWLIVGAGGAVRAWRAGPSGAVHDRFEPLEIADEIPIAGESSLAPPVAPRH